MLLYTKWIFPTDFGQLISFDNKTYLVDFENNEVREYKDPGFSQSIARINENYLGYYDNGTIYYLNGRTWQYDSVKVPLSKFEKSNFKVWKKSKTGLAIGIAPIFLILAATAARKRKAKAAREAILSSSDPISVTSTTVAKIRFSETEKQLLQVLLEKSKKKETTPVNEINYVLGIKDKNQGLQKKVRSEVINSINEKFSFLYPTHNQLIGNVRSQEDKRYFEYYIDEKNNTFLEDLLKEA